MTYQRKAKILKFDTKKSKNKTQTEEDVSYQHESDFFVKFPKRSVKSIMPICCPVCSFVMTHHNDTLSFKKYKCCYDCQTMWAEKYKQKWLDGWRPKMGEIKKLKNDMNTVSISLNLENN